MTLSIALDDTLPASWTVPPQIGSHDAFKHTSRNAHKYSYKYDLMYISIALNVTHPA